MYHVDTEKLKEGNESAVKEYEALLDSIDSKKLEEIIAHHDENNLLALYAMTGVFMMSEGQIGLFLKMPIILAVAYYMGRESAEESSLSDLLKDVKL